MTDRQSKLITYLRCYSDGYVKQQQILEDMAEDYGFYPKENQSYHETTARLLLTKDISYIKTSGYATIIHSNKGIKLAQVDECYYYHLRRINEAKRMLVREYKALRALGQEKQFDMDGFVKEIIDG